MSQETSQITEDKDASKVYDIINEKEVDKKIKTALEQYEQKIDERFTNALEKQSSYWIEFLKEDMDEFEKTQATNLRTIIALLRKLRKKNKDMKDWIKVMDKDVRRLKNKEWRFAIKKALFPKRYRERRKLGVTKAQKRLNDRQEGLEEKQKNLQREMNDITDKFYMVLNALMKDEEPVTKLKKKVRRRKT